MRLWTRKENEGIRPNFDYTSAEPQSELASRAKASSARSLGREGLVLTYLETLKEMANSPSTTILLPAEMSGDPDAVLKAAKHER